MQYFSGKKVCGKRGFVDRNDDVSTTASKREEIDFDSLHKDLHPERAKDEVATAPKVIKNEENAPAVVVSKASKGQGWFARLNRCCIDHENCDKFIPAKSEKFGFNNEKEYTIYDCKCDDSFGECLRYADSHTADAVGDLYFNVLKMPCINFGEGANATVPDDQLIKKVDKLVEERLKEKEKEKQAAIGNEVENGNGVEKENGGEKEGKEKSNEENGGGMRSSVGNVYFDPTEREAKKFKSKGH